MTFPARIPLTGRAWNDSSGVASAVPCFVAGEENALLAPALEPLLAAPVLGGPLLSEDTAEAETTDADGHAPTAPSLASPLVLAGPAGSGKSHIAQGLARRLAESLPEDSVVYYTGRDLARTLRAAAQDRRTGELLGRLNRAEFFVLENLEELRERPYAQRVLRQLLDDDLQRGRTVVVTSKNPPGTLAGFDPGLLDRLSAGLIVRIQAPGLESRRVLLRLAATAMRVPLSEAELETLAAQPLRTVPGLLQSLAAFTDARESGAAAPAGPDGSTPQSEQGGTSLKEIIAVTSRYFGVTQAALKGPSRRRSLVRARSVAAYLTRELTDDSYAEIGRGIGGRDHTTVMHAVRSIRKKLASDLETQNAVDQLHRLLS
ncbi:MAG: helix-turn-helix domain-containing protein [Planctomycetota bacterium]